MLNQYDESARIILLGGSTKDLSGYQTQFDAIKQSGKAAGFAVGRSVFWPVWQAVLAGEISLAEVPDKIAEIYCTNDFIKSKALIDTGYSKRYATTRGLKVVYENERVKAAIAKKITELRVESVATRQKRQEFWTKTMKDSNSNMGDRLRASELLGKSEADFTENINTGDLERLKKLSEQQALEAKRLAAIRLREA